MIWVVVDRIGALWGWIAAVAMLAMLISTVFDNIFGVREICFRVALLFSAVAVLSAILHSIRRIADRAAVERWRRSGHFAEVSLHEVKENLG